MGNCLVTKLKGVVDNSSLKKLGEARFTIQPISGSVDNQRNFLLNPIPGKTITVSIIGSVGSFRVAGGETSYTTYNVTQETTLTFSDEATAYDVSITSKYDISAISITYEPNTCVKIRMSEFLYCSAVTFNAYHSMVEDYNIADILTMPNVNYFVDEDTGHCEGDLSVLAGRSFSHINLSALPGQKSVTGDINNIASDILDRAQFLGTRVTGSIESFVAAMIDKGHPTYYFDQHDARYFQADQMGSYLTFGGEKHPVCHGAGIMLFESTSRILLGVGSYSIDFCKEIIVKGATASEIAAWEGAGKTVVVIA